MPVCYGNTEETIQLSLQRRRWMLVALPYIIQEAELKVLSSDSQMVFPQWAYELHFTSCLGQAVRPALDPRSGRFT